ncbi:MAG: glycogen synthase [Acidimicrobiales bacterium]
MRVLFAAAELAPVARVGGLAEAAAGLVRALRRLGVEVEVVLPDYAGGALDDEELEEPLALPSWAQPAWVRRGVWPGAGEVTLVETPGVRRPHPYLDPVNGLGWPDNDRRFLAFSAVVAALAERRRPDVVHLNDWHSAAALGFLTGAPPPSVLTIHTLGYQGVCGAQWLGQIPRRPEAYEWYGGTNPLSGGIALADRIVAVSPTYAAEILTPEMGAGLDGPLRARAGALVGIRNGIDDEAWDPTADRFLPAPFSAADLAGRARCRAELAAELNWPDDPAALVGMVTRLVDQKGVDLALAAAPFLAHLPARLVILGAGDRALAAQAAALALGAPDRVAFVEGYDEGLGRRIFGGADLFLMPSRFEPCGLAQMQAMAYGALPVVSDLGGLHDTVVDLDAQPEAGTGILLAEPSAAGVVDGLHRAVRALADPGRRRAAQTRGMTADWSWTGPATRHLALYEELLAGR